MDQFRVFVADLSLVGRDSLRMGLIGFEVQCGSSTDFLERFVYPDLILTVPDSPFLRRVEVPVVIWDDSPSVDKTVENFYNGAVECLGQGMDPREINARIYASIRRYRTGHTRKTVSTGDLAIDFQSQTVRKKGELVPLTPTETRLFFYLADHLGEIIDQKKLMIHCWGEKAVRDLQYLRLYVRYLRQKIEDDPYNPKYIINKWGTGYSLEKLNG